jgi:hypothetical protein
LYCASLVVYYFEESLLPLLILQRHLSNHFFFSNTTISKVTATSSNVFSSLSEIFYHISTCNGLFYCNISIWETITALGRQRLNL